MSTKTTFKRVALVAVASLGFGVLTSVAPANAALIVTPTTQSATFGAVTRTAINTWETTATVTATLTAGFDATDTVEVSVGTLAGAAKGTATAAVIATTGLTLAGGVGTYTVPADATSITFSAKVRFTAATDLTIANVEAAAGTYSVPLKVGDVSDALTGVTTGVNVVISSTATGSFLAGTAYDGSGAALTQIVNGQATVVFVAGTSDTSYTVTSSGVGTMLSATETAGGNAEVLLGTTVAQGFTWTPVTTVQSQTIIVTSATAGVATLTFRPVGALGVPGIAVTATVTFIDAPTASSALSTAFIGTGTAFAVAEATAGALRFPSTAGTTVHANISVTLNDANGAALAGQSISATVTGPGLISATPGAGGATAGTARAASITAAANTTNQFHIGISADGTRGVSTITVLRGTTVIATKTVTFYGAVATLTATQGVGVMGSGRTAASLASSFVLGGSSATELAADASTRAKATNISIVAKDVDGNIVPLAIAPTADISDVTVISDVTITSCANGGATTVCAAGAGNWIASTMPAIGGVSGATATVTFKTPNPAVPGAFISSAALPFSLGGTKTGGTVTMTLDKATYEPGERMIITYTARDAAGNPVQDWTTVGTPASNKAMVGLNTAGVYVAGSHIYGDGSTELTYAPTAPGPFVITLATGTSTTATITATATVADDAATTAAQAAGDAAAEATDAANAATDAANAAAEAADAATAAAQDAADAVAALSTSVSAMIDTLRKQITSLTNLVIKIQKKVRA
jgi:hypothetical protein